MSHLQQLWPFPRVLVAAAAVVSRQSPFLGKGKVRSEQCADRETFDSAAAGGASLNERNRRRESEGETRALTTMAGEAKKQRRLELEKKKERASLTLRLYSSPHQQQSFSSSLLLFLCS